MVPDRVSTVFVVFVPVNSTVPLLWVNVPLLIFQLPPTVVVLDASGVKLPPETMDTLPPKLSAAELVMALWKVQVVPVVENTVGW